MVRSCFQTLRVHVLKPTPDPFLANDRQATASDTQHIAVDQFRFPRSQKGGDTRCELARGSFVPSTTPEGAVPRHVVHATGQAPSTRQRAARSRRGIEFL